MNIVHARGKQGANYLACENTKQFSFEHIAIWHNQKAKLTTTEDTVENHRGHNAAEPQPKSFLPLMNAD
jgi:hypothetical protein